jgi:hypothetical protein
MESGEIIMWIKQNDDNIRHLWECPDCDDHAYVKPWWYSENGTPFCADCENDMEYIRTEMDIP